MGVAVNSLRYSYSVHCTSTRRSLYIFECADLVTSRQTFLFLNIKTECSVFIVITQTILFLSAKLVPRGKIFGKGEGSPDSADTPSRRDFRAIMYYDYCQEKSFHKCFQSLSDCFGDHSPSWSTVHKWYKEFQFHKTTFEDSAHYGLFVTVTTEQNVATVKCRMTEEPRITENEIRNNFNRSSGCWNRIFRHHLGEWKRCALWVPHQLPEEQRRGREWSLHILRKFDGGRSERVWDNVTGNETFVY